jgi:hypothetical protein
MFWAVQGTSSTGAATLRGLTGTADGVLLAGSSQNAMTIGTWAVSPGTTTGAYVASIGLDGCPRWASRITGTGATMWDVAVDGAGRPVATASAGGTITFLPGNTQRTITTSMGTQTLVVWLTPSGALSQVVELGGTQNEEPAAIATTPNTVCVLGRRMNGTLTQALTYFQLWSDGGLAWAGEASGGMNVGDFPYDVVGLPDDTCVFASTFGMTPTGIVPSAGYIGAGAYSVARFATDAGLLSNSWFRPSSSGSAALAPAPGMGVLLAATGAGSVSIGGATETLTRSAGFLVLQDVLDGGSSRVSRSDEVSLGSARVVSEAGEVWMAFSQAGDAGTLGWAGHPLPRSGPFTTAVLVRGNTSAVNAVFTAASLPDGGSLATLRFVSALGLSPGAVWLGGNFRNLVEVGGTSLTSPGADGFYLAPFVR